MLDVEKFLAGLDRKTLVRAVLCAYDCPGEGRSFARQALADFGHEIPKDVWGYATDGEIRDKDVMSPPMGSQAPWIVEMHP